MVKLILLERCIEPIMFMLPFRLPMSLLARRRASSVGFIFTSSIAPSFNYCLLPASLFMVTMFGKANACYRRPDESGLLLVFSFLESSGVSFTGDFGGEVVLFKKPPPLFLPSKAIVKSARTLVSNFYFAIIPPSLLLPCAPEPESDGVASRSVAIGIDWFGVGVTSFSPFSKVETSLC